MSGAPQHPPFSLAYFKKQAKRLARALKRGEPTAADRARKYFSEPSAVTLAGAQLVIAREHGYPSWRALRASIGSAGNDAVSGREPDTSVSARDMIKDVIDHETEPLTDAQIADELSSRGIPIARRTVAKYREQLGILPSVLRGSNYYLFTK